MGIFNKPFKPNVKKLAREGDLAGLLAAMRHDDPQVQSAAVRAIGESADPGAAEILLDSLPRHGALLLSPKEVHYLTNVCSVLGELREQRALGPLRKITEAEMPSFSGGFFSLEEATRAALEAKDGFDKLQRAAREAIKKIEDKSGGDRGASGGNRK